MSENTVSEKSMRFSVRIVRLYHYLADRKKEYVLSKQILRAGTSIGANIAEAESSYSKRDFLAKMYIAFKECAETNYWLRLLYNTGYLSKREFDSINRDCMELKNMLSAITKTTRENLEKQKEEESRKNGRITPNS